MRLELPTRRLALEVEQRATDVEPHGPPVILIMGLGMQLTAWPEPLLRALSESGRRVILFDNRDIGLSETGPLPRHHSMVQALCRYPLGKPVVPAYSLYDMADDVLALADALQLENFDLVGVSMGGMIAQILAGRAPQRVRRLVSIMSSAGPATTPRPSLRLALKSVFRPGKHAALPTIVRHYCRLFEDIGALHHAEDLAAMKASVERSMARAYRPEGTSRQLLAVLAAPDRSAEVMRIRAPMLILHGKRDPLIAFEAALHLKRLLPGATLRLLPEMGHYLSRSDLPELFGHIDAHLSA